MMSPRMSHEHLADEIERRERKIPISQFDFSNVHFNIFYSHFIFLTRVFTREKN